METLLADLRYGARMLLRRPGFAATARCNAARASASRPSVM